MIEGGIVDAVNQVYAGRGVLGGYLPEVGTPEGADGRAKIANVPSVVRILVLDKRTMIVVRSIYSRRDGGWEVTNINPDFYYMVIGTLSVPLVNSAIQDWVKPYVQEP